MTVNSDGIDFLVKRDDWKQSRFVEAPLPELAPQQVLFRVDRFAFTANNISYAVAGDALGYWRFFQAPESWGRIPVMGYADVIRSTHPDVAEGTRCFGFYPMSRHLVIEPSAASASKIVDGAAHRKGISPAYNQYSPVKSDAIYHPEHEDALMVLRGLFLTSFLADDFIADEDYFGAKSVLISSASSKTSIALGHQVSRGGRATAIGLTSSRNLNFANKLGCYDRVFSYEEITSLDPSTSAVYVDMAGSGPIRRSIHRHFGNQLHYDCAIGATHWNDTDGSNQALPGPKPTFFFAPKQIQKRVADWCASGFQERVGEAWSVFRDFSDSWLQVKRGYGRDAVEKTYVNTLDGNTRPEHGHVLSLWDSA